MAVRSINTSIAYRTVIAAANGGELRKLRYNEDMQGVQPLFFAVRSLLPRWVSLEDAGHGGSRDAVSISWHQAAMSLRPRLAHASLWLGRASSDGARNVRTLTSQEVQALRAYFSEAEVPESARAGQGTHIETYLSWLEEDAALAEKVAQACYSLVGSAEAYIRKCSCELCSCS